MVRVEQLTKVYEAPKKKTKTLAVDHIDFEARSGEVLGLLGPNGAGKTTTLRMLATILKPTSGTALVNGYDVVRQSRDVRRSIGFLSGDMGLYHRLTAREMLRFYGGLTGVEPGALNGRIENLIDKLEMTSFVDRRIESYSTGMRQRVAIARTLVHDPPVLILDEPTAGLDVPSAHAVERFILDAKTAGKCILYSTHVMEEAEYICDRIAVIHQGHIQTIGTMDQLREQTGKQRLREIFLGVLGLEANRTQPVA
jgi:sodium transport system ATP-binding protein